MEQSGYAEDRKLKDVLDDFISAYAKKDTDIKFSIWLSDRLCREIPGMTPEAGSRLADEIISAVAGYDNALHDLNVAMEAGASKEEWFSGQMEKACEGMQPEAAGDALQRMENDLFSVNSQLMGEGDRRISEAVSHSEKEAADWNRYSIKAKHNDIGKQVKNVVLAAAANALKREAQGEEPGGIGTVINDALRDGLHASSEEIKSVVAGAVRVYAEKQVGDALPEDTPIEVIGALAGVAVDGAEALCDAANGDITIMEAMDKMGRAGVAAWGWAGAAYLRGKLMALPGGVLLVDLLGGLLDHLASQKFANDVYTVLQNTVKATWEGIKKSKIGTVVGRLWEKVKSPVIAVD